ncbi:MULTISPECIES: hypothetical protein [Kordiimonas]|uniref:hypothetical protein n=1 Tax=Kordiimonas TaxID=288021 RepID=UPI002580F3BB|nr:hypothetical protein [Kordiimonas sp. UBA4487]
MFEVSRRKLLGASMLGGGLLLSSLGGRASGEQLARKGRILLNQFDKIPDGLNEAVSFPLIEAIHGRRSRRFALGASIPDGPFKYQSKHEAKPLSELEQMLLLTTVGGNTGWSNLIPYNRFYLPNIPNYAGASGGRTFPSAAGFHTSDIFYTDDNGVYYLPTRDMPSAKAIGENGETDLNGYLEEHKKRIVKLADGRLNIPAAPEHMEMHNEWCANVPGSTFIIPVADLAQHHILNLCYLVQNGACIYDDTKGKQIPGLDRFKSLVDIGNPYPMSFVDQMSLTEVTVETSTACYSGALMLQALGLGGWMYQGVNPFSVLGASGDPAVPGLGFSYDLDDRWPLPNVTGLEGVFEGHCPPHFPDMRAAVDSVIDRKFGKGGPFNKQTSGPYKNTEAARGSAAPVSEEFRQCVSVMAQYIYDEYGRFPASVPSIFTMMYLQAHKLDTDFYDHYHEAGGYLRTHANNKKNW